MMVDYLYMKLRNSSSSTAHVSLDTKIAAASFNHNGTSVTAGSRGAHTLYQQI